MTPAGTTGWITALTLRKARHSWRPAITAAILLVIVVMNLTIEAAIEPPTAPPAMAAS